MPLVNTWQTTQIKKMQFHSHGRVGTFRLLYWSKWLMYVRLKVPLSVQPISSQLWAQSSWPCALPSMSTSTAVTTQRGGQWVPILVPPSILILCLFLWKICEKYSTLNSKVFLFFFLIAHQHPVLRHSIRSLTAPEIRYWRSNNDGISMSQH